VGISAMPSTTPFILLRDIERKPPRRTVGDKKSLGQLTHTKELGKLILKSRSAFTNQ
jgi:hypothetical protein